MTRIVAAALVALALTAPVLAAPALAQDRVVHLTFDGRPIDNDAGVAFLHRGIAYVDLVVLVKAYDGLMSWRAPSQWVTINGLTAVLTPGSRTMRVQEKKVQLPGPVLRHKGMLLVPLDAFVTSVGGKVTHRSATRAEIIANAPTPS